MLAAVRAHLEPGGLLAVALADPFGGVPAGEFLPPLPDVLEVDGWVLSSTPVDGARRGRVRVGRPPPPGRVAGGGPVRGGVHARLDSVAPGALEAEGAEAGFTPLAPREVPDTRDYVGSTVVMLEAPR